MSTSKIKVLSETTINKIAAGEVIENPASVVKELVENSLDAGTTSLCIEIKQGGRELIRVSDDGEGMSYDDALLCLERHATSKIKEVEELEELATMGFRGEAIPSIASISKFSLLTATQEGKETGTYLHVDGGKIITHAKATRAKGTTIEVKTLFFNVPVRRKFQKSPTSDESEILRITNILALAHPDIQFELISDEKNLLKTSSTLSDSFREKLNNRIEATLGKEFSKNSLYLEHKTPLLEIKGFVGSSSIHRPNKTGQFLFINKRAVFSPLIASFVKEGYGTMLPSQRYPIFVLHLTLPGNLVDVNVHPQKKEVRLRQETVIREAILNAMQAMLRKEQGLLYSSPIQEKDCMPAAWGAPFAKKESKLSPSPFISDEEWHFSETREASMKPSSSEMTLYPRESHTLSSPSLPLMTTTTPKVLATIVGYILLESFHIPSKLLTLPQVEIEGGLFLVDQQRASARIIFEKLLRQEKNSDVQPLLLPVSLILSKPEFEAVRTFEKELTQIGFEIRLFGENSVVIDTLPSTLKIEDAESLFKELIDDLIEHRHLKKIENEKEKRKAQLAFKISCQKSKRLSQEEATTLINELLRCNISSICPIGRPVACYFSPEEMKRWFDK